MDLCAVIIDVEIVMEDSRLRESLDIGVRIENQPTAGQILDLLGDVRASAHLPIFKLPTQRGGVLRTELDLLKL
jgi:hypothetical protein